MVEVETTLAAVDKSTTQIYAGRPAKLRKKEKNMPPS